MHNRGMSSVDRPGPKFQIPIRSAVRSVATILLLFGLGVTYWTGCDDVVDVVVVSAVTISPASGTLASLAETLQLGANLWQRPAERVLHLEAGGLRGSRDSNALAFGGPRVADRAPNVPAFGAFRSTQIDKPDNATRCCYRSNACTPMDPSSRLC